MKMKTKKVEKEKPVVKKTKKEKKAVIRKKVAAARRLLKELGAQEGRMSKTPKILALLARNFSPLVVGKAVGVPRSRVEFARDTK
jgi:hypothetical protein